MDFICCSQSALTSLAHDRSKIRRLPTAAIDTAERIAASVADLEEVELAKVSESGKRQFHDQRVELHEIATDAESLPLRPGED